MDKNSKPFLFSSYSPLRILENVGQTPPSSYTLVYRLRQEVKKIEGSQAALYSLVLFRGKSLPK